MSDQNNARLFQLAQAVIRTEANVEENPPLSPANVILSTPDFSFAQVEECQRMAWLNPPLAATPELPCAFGVFRGLSAEHIIAKAQRLPNGGILRHYLLTPTAAMRWLGGNYTRLEAYATRPLPDTSVVRNDLSPFVLDNPEPPTPDAQTDLLLDLMTYCKNNLKIIEGLLAAVVQAMPVGIINPPATLSQRMRFVQGLLMLLPIPARIGITFVTSATKAAPSTAQISFLETSEYPDNYLIYDWAAKKLLTTPPEDSYSKYMVAQLRLDTSLVIEQTDGLARTLVWRAMRKDDIANALAWVSKRASIDSAVLNNQPADRALVASILREDPTMPDSMRASYAKHLLSMALALNDHEFTDVLPVLATQHQQVAREVFEQLRMSAGKLEQAPTVYELVKSWVMQSALGAETPRWQPLLGLALQTQFHALAEQSNEQPLVSFLEKLSDEPSALQLDRTVIHFLAGIIKRAYESAPLAREVFLLACRYLPLGNLQRLLNDKKLRARLAPVLQNTLDQLVPQAVEIPLVGALVNAAQVYGPQHKHLILGRLMEWAFLLQRYDLLDDTTLQQAADLARSEQGNRFDTLLDEISHDMSDPTKSPKIPPTTLQHLMTLALVRPNSDPHSVVAKFKEIQNDYFGLVSQGRTAEVIRTSLRSAKLSATQVVALLDEAQRSELRPMARYAVLLGVLDGLNWEAAAAPTAQRLATALEENPRSVALIGVDAALQLLQFYASQQDLPHTLKTAHTISDYAILASHDALHEEEAAINQVVSTVTRLYEIANWNQTHTSDVLAIVREFVRRAPLPVVYKLLGVMRERFGAQVANALDTTYQLRLAIGGSTFAEFSTQVTIAARLLEDMAAVYYVKQETPSLFKLQKTISEVPGSLSSTELQRFADNLKRIGELIIRLYSAQQTQNAQRSRMDNDTLQERLLLGTVVPSTGWETLIWFSGYFGNGAAQTLSLERQAPPHFWGTRSINLLLRETDAIVILLNDLLAAFTDKMTNATPAEWRAEVEQVWRYSSLYQQRQMQEALAVDSQLLAHLLTVIGVKGNERSLQDTGTGYQLFIGKQQPFSVIEALRWFSGYYAQAHKP